MSLYYGQLVVGPAGSGKSTYCQQIQEMASSLRRRVLVFNLDPAAEQTSYRCDFDIRELVTLQDVMEELGLGPNGGLVHCFEYLLDNQEWLDELLAGIGQDDYVLFDCPGQIELYTHLPAFKELIRRLVGCGFALLSVYLMDVSFTTCQEKLASGLLQALACTVGLELPALTVLSKCDLANEEQLESALRMADCPEEVDLGTTPDRKLRLTKAVLQVLRHNNQFSLSKLNIQDEDSIRDLLNEADIAIQYGENLQPDDRLYDEPEAD